ASRVALRTMAAAAAVVVLAGGGYEIAQHVGGSSPSSTGAAAPVAGPPERGTNQSAASGSEAAPQRPYLHAGHQDIPVITSGTNYTPANLRSQVRSNLALYRTAGTTPPPLPPPASSAQQTATADGIPVQTLQGCVTRIAARQPGLLLDAAIYRGAPATVILTRPPAC